MRYAIIQKQEQGRKVPQYRTLHAVADSHKRIFREAFLSAAALLLDIETRREIRRALGRGDLNAAENLFPFATFDQELQLRIEEAIQKTIESAGNASAKFVPIPVIPAALAGVALSFNVANPAVLEFIQTRAADLVVEIGQETRMAIRQIIRRGFEEGLGADAQAELLENVVGLTRQQAGAVANFRAKLIAEGVKGAKLQRMMKEKYEDSLRFRAERIARTETIVSASRGQMEMYNQFSDEGIIDKKNVVREWIVTPDDRLCSFCRPLAGKQAAFDGFFTSGLGNVLHPPLHPMCRCAIRYVFLD